MCRLYDQGRSAFDHHAASQRDRYRRSDAIFSVSASGTAPLSYQWNKNGMAIGGATLSSYTTPPETTSGSGARFSVTVSNSAGNSISNAAMLTVSSAPSGAPYRSQPAHCLMPKWAFNSKQSSPRPAESKPFIGVSSLGLCLRPFRLIQIPGHSRARLHRKGSLTSPFKRAILFT